MIAMTIMGVMSVMVLSVYFSVTNTSRKLSATRHLSETAREITERIAQDIRENGISLSGSAYDDYTVGNELWKNPDYTGSGGEILGIGTESSSTKMYIYGKKVPLGADFTIDHCRSADKQNPKTLCGLYLVENKVWKDAYNLADSFIPEEEKKRVKVEDLRFYISGDDYTSKKVMIHFTLSLMPRIGVPSSLVNSTKLRIQTTLSERIFKTY